MKYVVLLCDGMADYPVEALGNMTPMEKSVTPNMDKLAPKSQIGLVKTVADGMKPGSDVANLSVLGYDPAVCYTGRSPLEAGSIGIDMKDTDISFRCNLVTVSDEKNFEDRTLVDYCADDISTADAKVLVEYLAEHFDNDEFKLYNGVSYRHCLIWNNGTLDVGTLTPPHDISDRKIKDYLPSDERILYLMKKSEKILKNHPINQKRIAEGKNPATSMWIWGEGTKPALNNFYETYGKKGAVVSAVDLIKGIAILAGMNSIDVEGATGNIHTNFDGKAKAAADALLREGADLVYVHLEAPDECGHQGDAEGKVRSLELIDEKVIGYIKARLEEAGEDYAFLVMPDHPTPIATKTHSREAVPCVIYKKGDNKGNNLRFIEKDAEAHGTVISEGYKIMSIFLNK